MRTLVLRARHRHGATGLTYGFLLGAIALGAFVVLDETGERVAELFGGVGVQLAASAGRPTPVPFVFDPIAPPARVGDPVTLSGTAPTGSEIDVSGPGLGGASSVIADGGGRWTVITAALTEEGPAEFSAELEGVQTSSASQSIVVPGCSTLPDHRPSWPLRCANGEIYVGRVDGARDLFIAACDAGQTWNGHACVGIGSTTLTLNYGPTRSQVFTQAVTIDTTDGDPSNDRLLLTYNNGSASADANRVLGIGGDPQAGNQSPNFFNGLQLTEFLVSLEDDPGTPGVDEGAGAPYLAAVFCDNLSAHGSSDWYLPARWQLANIHTVAYWAASPAVDPAEWGFLAPPDGWSPGDAPPIYVGNDPASGLFSTNTVTQSGNPQQTPANLWGANEFAESSFSTAFVRQLHAPQEVADRLNSGMAVRCMREIPAD